MAEGSQEEEARAIRRTLGSGIAQVGIVVPDLDRAIADADALGSMGPFRSYTMESGYFDELIHRGSRVEMSFRVALNRSTPQLEFIEPLEGESVYREFLELSPTGGMHHLGFIVPDIEATTGAFADQGFEPVFHGRGYGRADDGGFAYFDTAARLGYWVEAIETPSSN